MTPARLLSVLPRGADTAITLAALAERLGVSRREVEQAIQAARLAGWPIITSEKGAHVAQDAQEVASMAERLRSRAIHQLLTARALRRVAHRMREAEARVEPLTLPWDVAA